MINLGNINSEDVLKKIAIYYNISIPIGKGLVNYDPEPISDHNDVETEILPSNWKTLGEFSVDYYKGRYLDLEFKIQNSNVYLTSAPWVTILGFNSELSEEEVEDLLDEYLALGIDHPNILLRHQHRMINFKEVIDAQITNIANDGGLTEEQKKIDYDLKKIADTKVTELIENYSERF